MSDPLKHKILTVGNILYRNTFILINEIIAVVVFFLVIFGDVKDGAFLGFITLLNMLLGSLQEIRAWLTLEKLQSLVTPKVILINDNQKEQIILAEEIKKGDHLKLKMGDQVPCDGHLLISHGFEVNEALITGESTSFLRVPGDKIFSGGIITSGTGVMQAEETSKESRIARMTENIKKYNVSYSPIQHDLNRIIKYASYVLLLAIGFIVGRGVITQELPISIIQNIGAVSSLLLPQGIVLVVTLIFAYGAYYLYQSHILLQEVNATEKIGRIKNLCMDKTGTLTDNNLEVKNVYLKEGVKEEIIKKLAAAYIQGSRDVSLSMLAIKKFIESDFTGEIIEDLSFSSSRGFGAVKIKNGNENSVILAGGPDVLSPHLESQDEKWWLQGIIDKETKMGNRLILLARAEGEILPHELKETRLSVLVVFVLNNNLRQGVFEAVNFFQNRGVKIRIISGDNENTVKAVAMAAGIKNTDAIIGGGEIEKWKESDFLTKSKEYTIFARVKPEQKEKIILALKQSGFTAMVGDGANDALAIKKADLGIAMFDGARATRQIASMVLVKNSFADLPKGVKMSDNIIENIEIYASIFFNQSLIGFFFFLILSILGHSFPFTPLNITFMNYFTIGLPGLLIFYWIIKPGHSNEVLDPRPFFKRVLPFPLVSAIPQSLLVIFAFFMSFNHLETKAPASLVILVFIAAGLIFFMSTPKVYTGLLLKIQKKELFSLVALEIISILIFIRIPFVASFYDLKAPSLYGVLILLPFVLIYSLIQFVITKKFFTKNSREFVALH